MRNTVLRFSLIIACAASAQAFSFQPISQDFAPSGPDASHVFRVNNTTEERIAVQISVRPRRIEVDGTEIQGKESAEFIVYPRQMLLEPSEQRSVRVRWNGPSDIDVERSYRVIAEQVPVDFGEVRPAQGASIRLTYRYEGSLYVVPPGAVPAVHVKRVYRQPDDEMIILELENTGTRHALLRELSVFLMSEEEGDVRVVLGPNELPGVAGENMLAGSVRRFAVPAPADLWSGPMYADIEFSRE